MFLTIPTQITLTSIVNFSVAFLAVLMGVVVLWRDEKSAVHQLFFLVAFNTGFWAFSSTMADVVREYGAAFTWARMAIVGPFFLSAAFLILSYYFPAKVGAVGPKKAILICLPSLIALALTPTRFNVVQVTLQPWGTDFTPGPLYTILFVHLLLYFGLAGRHFYTTFRKSDSPVVKKQILFLTIGMILVVVSGIVTNLVLPLVFSYTKASVIGPAATLFFVVLTMYAIIKHGLLDLKVIATEIFAGIFVFVSFIQLFRSFTPEDFATNVVVFISTSVAAVLLVKSVIGEVRRREQLHILSLELADANTHLKEMDKLKSEFISIASHQLRTPISVIKGYISLMLEGAYGKVEGPLKEKMESMNTMNERLVQMINNMLNVSRIEKNKIEYNCLSIDVVPVIREVAEEMTYKATQKGIAVRADIEATDELIAYGDAAKLHEVLTNIIDNAIKYSARGTITIAAKRQPKKKGILITVKDEGFGMRQEDAKQTFQKFFRAKDPSVAREVGTGLGLYICAIFMRGMGGDIWIEKTAPGKGTTVALLLAHDALNLCTPRVQV